MEEVNFLEAWDNEYQWRNLYRQRWGVCTYPLGTWRQANVLRREFPGYPVVRWAADREYDNWHAVLLLRRKDMDPLDRMQLLNGFATVAAAACGTEGVVRMVSTLAAREAQHVLGQVDGARRRRPGTPLHAALRSENDLLAQLVRLTAGSGAAGRFTAGLVEPFCRSLASQASSGISSVVSLCTNLLRRLSAVARNMPLDLWAAVSTPQKVLNAFIVDKLAVPGFDVSLLTVRGTKEAANPAAEAAVGLAVQRHLLCCCWLLPALRAPQEWIACYGDENAEEQRVALFNLICSVGDRLDEACAVIKQVTTNPLEPTACPAGFTQPGSALHTAMNDMLSTVFATMPDPLTAHHPTPTAADLADAADVVARALADHPASRLSEELSAPGTPPAGWHLHQHRTRPVPGAAIQKLHSLISEVPAARGKRD